MKQKRIYLFIIISAVALLIVLIIQVNWIMQTAKIKEELFNEKANMVLSKTADALSSDKATCQKMETGIGNAEIKKTDSLFTNYMEFYNFDTKYSFAVTKPNASDAQKENNVYKKRLAEVVTKNGLELNLFVPDKKKSLLEDMGMMFIASLMLIVVVLFLFWRTIISLIKEQKISEHTTDFLNNMTHEFKSPLTNIALATKMLIKDINIKQEDKIKHYSSIILAENEKLKLQVEQVLSMNALERGEIPLRKTELDFHQLINDAAKCMHIQIENAQGHLNLNLNAEKCVIMGDKTQLANALCNLMDNAVKYAKEKPELNILTRNVTQKLEIRVEDKGIGIEKEYQKQVFEKFFRVPTGDIHDVKGFGLGLTYLKKIVELHNGTIELQSEKGKGTTFIITFQLL
jgi:two-component system phosphate regulon sensor histidine kinase PhoR